MSGKKSTRCLNFAPLPSIAVVVLNWNGKKDTLECLASLSEQTYETYTVIVVDNGLVFMRYSRNIPDVHRGLLAAARLSAGGLGAPRREPIVLQGANILTVNLRLDGRRSLY